ncbi:MAG: hypothetical protein AB1753_09075 [Thermoproteota archaeon]
MKKSPKSKHSSSKARAAAAKVKRRAVRRKPVRRSSRGGSSRNSSRRLRARVKQKPKVARARPRPPKARAPPATRKAAAVVVRIMGHGQFTVDARTLGSLKRIDDSLVEMVASEKADDAEFKKALVELNDVAIKRGKPVEPGEMVKTDIILPSADMPVDEAKKLFVGEGVIPAAMA